MYLLLRYLSLEEASNDKKYGKQKGFVMFKTNISK